MQMEGSTAIVTGGAHRLGRAFALELARAGADLVIDYHSSEAAAQRTAADIEALGRRSCIVRADVSNEDDVARLIEACETRFGRLDVVVNSASLFESAPVERIGAADWDRVMAVNLKGPFLMSRAAAPLLRRQQGLIVNIADLSAFQAWPSYAHHSVSKAGLVHLTRVLARAFAPEIRVNCIAPGTVLPPGEYLDEVRGAPNPDPPRPESDPAGERTALRRRGTPDDATRALRYFVEADYVTGEVAVVDGGRLLL